MNAFAKMKLGVFERQRRIIFLSFSLFMNQGCRNYGDLGKSRTSVLLCSVRCMESSMRRMSTVLYPS